MATGLFNRPANNTCSSDTPNVFAELSQSPVQFLGNILKKYPFLEIVPNSLLARAVYFEYETIKGSTSRPPWPEDLCGYIEAARDRDAQRNGRPAIYFPQVNGSPDTEYFPDECINQSMTGVNAAWGNVPVTIGAVLPGTYLYDKCNSSKSNLIEDLYSVDWTSYFQNPSHFPDITDLTSVQESLVKPLFALNESAELEQINAAIAKASEKNPKIWQNFLGTEEG